MNDLNLQSKIIWQNKELVFAFLNSFCKDAREPFKYIGKNLMEVNDDNMDEITSKKYYDGCERIKVYYELIDYDKYNDFQKLILNLQLTTQLQQTQTDLQTIKDELQQLKDQMARILSKLNL